MQTLKKSNNTYGLWAVALTMAIAFFLNGCARPIIAPEDYGNRSLYVSKAEEHLKKGEYQAALEIYLELLRKASNSPDVADIKLGCAYAYEGLKRPEQAVSFYREVFYSYPYHPKRLDTGMRLAQVQTRVGLNQDAIRTLNETLRIASRTSVELDALWLLSMNYKTLKDYNTSLEFATRALNLDPSTYEKYQSHIEELIWKAERQKVLALKESLLMAGVPQLTTFLEKALRVELAHASSSAESIPAKAPSEQSVSVPKAKGNLKVGVLLPITGPYSELSREVITGAQLALDEAKRTAGKDPMEPRLVLFDTKGQDELVIEGIKTLSEKEGVDVILGPLGGDSVRFLKEAMQSQKLGLPVYAFTQRLDLIDPSLGLFGGLISPFDQIGPLLKRAVVELGVKKFAIIYPETPYGEGLARAFKEEAVRHGGSVIKEIPINMDAINLEGYSEALKNADGLFIPDTLNTVGIVLSELNNMEIKDKVLVSMDIHNPKDLMGLLRSTGHRGLIATAIYSYLIPEREPEKGLERRFFESSGREPSLFGVSSYLLMKLLLGNQGDELSIRAHLDPTGRIKAPTHLFWVSGRGALKIE